MEAQVSALRLEGGKHEREKLSGERKEREGEREWEREKEKGTGT